MLTDNQILINKWKNKTSLMDGIPKEHELFYARLLEDTAKKLIEKYGGKKEAPNIWPDVRRYYEQITQLQ